jgi:hypothetical protein
MRKKVRMLRILVNHFFRRFFDSDSIQLEGETLTLVTRAIAMVAAPGLITAFFLQNQYPQRSMWGRMEDQYFFILFSFVVMGAIAVFQWEMLFPDRLDFLVLTPLPIKPWQLLTAKVTALICFFSLFLFGANIFGAFMLPAVSKGDLYRQVYAHFLAVTLAGAFAAAFFLALTGILLCVMNGALFRLLSPLVQLLSITAIILSFLFYGRIGSDLQQFLSTPLGWARWVPPLWFLGVYQSVLHLTNAPPFAQQMAQYSFRATALAFLVVLITYPTAWVRMRRLAIEGLSSGMSRQSWWLRRLLQFVGRRPAALAILTFICQTLSRNNRYQVYLAMYGGVGLSLATFCAVDVSSSGSALLPQISNKGLHAALPLLLFWLISGLRIAFTLPLNLSAGWIFRLTGVSVRACADAARRWVFLCACTVLVCVFCLLTVSGMGYRQLFVQAIVGFSLCMLLTDCFFLGQPAVPFNKARMPGRTNLPLLLTLYLGAFPLFVSGVISLEINLEKHLARLLLLVSLTLGLNRLARTIEDQPEEIEEEMEGYEGEFQLLNLG